MESLVRHSHVLTDRRARGRLLVPILSAIVLTIALVAVLSGCGSSSPSSTPAASPSAAPAAQATSAIGPVWAAIGGADTPLTTQVVVYAPAFTAAERACVLRNLVDATSPDEFVKIVTGAEQQSSESVGKKIRSCVNAARLDVLVPKAAKAMLADRAAAKAEHDRKQAQLNAEIDALNRSSTTTR